MRAAAALALLAFVARTAAAQPAASPETRACPEPHEVAPAALVGLWRAEFPGSALPGATLLLQPHPEYPLSLKGGINRNGERGQVVADLEDGELTLEESADGKRIAATWLGDVAAGSCGREIRGSWQAREGRELLPFVLRKLAD